MNNEGAIRQGVGNRVQQIALARKRSFYQKNLILEDVDNYLPTIYIIVKISAQSSEKCGCGGQEGIYVWMCSLYIGI